MAPPLTRTAAASRHTALARIARRLKSAGAGDSALVTSCHPRGGRVHIVTGPRHRPQVFCGKVSHPFARLKRRSADSVDCRYCRCYLKGLVRKLLAECFPNWSGTIEECRYLHDFLDNEGRASEARLVRVYVDMFSGARDSHS